MNRSSTYLLPVAIVGLTHVLTFSPGNLSIGLAQPALAESYAERTLVVTGQGIERIPATLAQITLGIEVQRKTAQEAQQEAAQRSVTVIDLLRSRQIDRLQTNSIQLNPIYRSLNNQPSIVGYAATNTVSFQIESQLAGKLLDDAVQAGATRIESVNLTASETAIEKAQEQALKAATEDAQRQAKAVLSSLNLTPQEIISIQINNASPSPMPHAMRLSASNEADLATTAIVAGEQSVRALVTLQIKY